MTPRSRSQLLVAFLTVLAGIGVVVGLVYP